MQTKWEYQTEKFNAKGWVGASLDLPAIDARLKALGAEGWELASTVATNQAYGQTHEVVLIFKRART
jgi:hypothetical protein